ESPRCRGHAFGGGLFDVDGLGRVLLELLQLFDVLGFRARELLLAIGEGHMGAGVSERDGGLQSRVAASDDHDLLADKLFGVIKAIENFVEVLSWNAQPPVVAAAADGDDDAACPRNCFLVAMMEQEDAAFSLDSLDAREDRLDAGLLSVGLESLQQLLLGV